MDVVLQLADEHFLDKFYASLPLPTTVASHFARDALLRQSLSLWMITTLGGALLYFIFGSLSYFFLFDHNLKKHPKYLPNQVQREISLSLRSMPLMSLWTLPWFLGEVRGYSRLYDNISDYGIPYAIFSTFWFLFFTDCLIYWIHRGLHHPKIYFLHKPHHLWKVPTPFASHAFHHFDGYAQSLPYHIFVFLFPLQKFIYLGLFVFVNFWTISIHDQVYVAKDSFVNGAAHHTIHHLEFNYNYGQYFTLWDKVGGSYKKPEEHYFSKAMTKKDGKDKVEDKVEVVPKVDKASNGLRQRA